MESTESLFTAEVLSLIVYCSLLVLYEIMIRGDGLLWVAME